MTIEEMKAYIKAKIAEFDRDSEEGISDAYTDCLCLLMDWNGK